MRSAEIVRHRMHNQGLWGHRLDSPEEVVRRLGALQAQEYAYAKWSVAQRAAGVDEAAMDKALAAGTYSGLTFCGPPGISCRQRTSAGY